MNKASKDYYKILEVSKESSDKEIKQAYRRLSMKYHPDKNQHKSDDEKTACEEKFKEITEAHGILSDPSKRKNYDQFGICDGEAQGFPDMSDVFGGMGGFPFGGMGGQQRREQGPPVQEFKVKITISDLFNGCEKNLEIPINERCKKCDATGSTDKIKQTCKQCNGRGVCVTMRQVGPGMIQQQQSPCSNCNQTGKAINPSKKCNGCNGSGLTASKFKKTIKITPNYDYDTRMCIKRAGNYDIENESSSDIHIVFKLENEKSNLKIFNTYDLLLEYPIRIIDALTGFKMYYDGHPNLKKYLFEFKDIIKDNDIRYIAKLGLPHGNDVGKLIIKFNYIYPKNILVDESYLNFIKINEVKSQNDEYIKAVPLIYSEETERENERQSRRQQSSEEGVGCQQS